MAFMVSSCLDLKAIFRVRRERTAKALAEEFVSLDEEREYLGHGDSFEEQRGVGAASLSHDGNLRSRETKPKIFETLTIELVAIPFLSTLSALLRSP
jgi:hypothetical protein